MGTRDAFTASPMARHPRLLLRKVAARLLGGARRSAPAALPPRGDLLLATDPARLWALKSWLTAIPLHPAPHPFNRVFGVEFDEGKLLQLCRQGPDRTQRGLEGDIKLVWDYSRAHPLVTNAATGVGTLNHCAAFLRRWTEANVDLGGPAWSCAMDVAIRAVNWIVADALFAGALGRSLGADAWNGLVWRHGEVIARRLEFHLVSSNHYLADLLGLAAVGSVFPQESSARKWFAFAREDFPRALLAQTRADGGLNEASLRYHAFVTEMALLVRLFQGVAFPEAAEQRLRAMCQIVADFRDASGDVFALGDDDSGRVLALDFVSPLGRADILLRLASTELGHGFIAGRGESGRESAATGSGFTASYPQSGWFVRQAGDFTLALDFGGAGLWGRGSHAHNDDFSICLDWRQRSIIVDPGTCLYTSDLEARNLFRSTRRHNTLIVDDAEQQPLTSEPFLLPHADEAFPAAKTSADTWKFTRPLPGGALHRREVSVTGESVQITDHVDGPGRHQLEWRFHLHPGATAMVSGNAFILNAAGESELRLATDATDLTLRVEPAEYSPGYGRKEPSEVCIASCSAVLPHRVRWRIVPA